LCYSSGLFQNNPLELSVDLGGEMYIILLTWFGCGADKISDTAGDFVRDDTNINSQNDSDITDTQEDTNGGTGDIVYTSGIVSGRIDIQLYQDTVEGDREMLLWDDAYPSGTFPFGKLYVGAFYYNEVNLPVYVAYDIIENPQPTDNLYELDLQLVPGVSEVRIFAVLDYYQDNITGSDEPIGGYPQSIPVVSEMVVNDLDFSVLSPMYEPRPPCDTYPNGDPKSVTIDGIANVTRTYNGGDVAVFVLGAGGVGPVFSTSLTPDIDGDSAEGLYSLEVCEDIGYVSLRGCWDQNQNGMFEPMDKYGSYISAPNENGNPISVKYTDLSDYEVQIPLGSSDGLTLLPFMSVSGLVKANGLFDDLSDGGRLHIVALKFRPQGSISITDIEEIQSYDTQTYEWEELQGKTEVSFTLMAPKETIIYLWAYIDVDSNGYVNESLEPVASAGEDDNGKFPTGNINIEGVNMTLTVMD
jgi:hypothetical protein